MSTVSMINGHIDKHEEKKPERDRLIELIKDGHSQYIRKISGKTMYEEIADYLIENGVIVPPCKVGDKVYVIEPCNCGHKYGERCSANRIRKNTKWLEIVKLPPTHHHTRCLKLFARPFRIEYLNRIGKTVFTSKEEALSKLQAICKQVEGVEGK